MFELLGRTISRVPLVFLATWVVILLGTSLAAPSWAVVALDKEFGFLPPNSPSVRAEAVFQQAFPDDHSGSNIVLVVSREGSPSELERDKKFIEAVLERGLRQIADAEGGLAATAQSDDNPLFPGEHEPAASPQRRSIIARIRTPNAPGTGSLLVSLDNRVLLVVLELTTEFLSNENWPVIAKVEEIVRTTRQEGKFPAGVDVHVTGSAVIGRDHSRAELQSVRATELLTMALVVVLLLAIYRAPILALIPIATVALAVKIALNFLAILAGAGYVTLFQGLQIYITILAYGAGVDYCVFLTARYREALEEGAANSCEAMAQALRGVGAALVASAATVICGIGMMAFAEFGKFRQAGLAIPLSIVLVLVATLTFTPAFLCLAGRWSFWPQRLGMLTATPSTDGAVALAPRSGVLRRGWERFERLLVRRPAAVWLVTVGLMAPFAILAGFLHDEISYDLVASLPEDAPSVAGTRLLREHMPAGLIGQVTVLVVAPRIDFGGPGGRELIARLTDRLREQRQDLGIADVRSLTAPLGITVAAREVPVDPDVPGDVRQETLDRAALERYVTDLGERAKVGTRLDLVLEQSPFARESLAALGRIEETVRGVLPLDEQADVQLYTVGATASVHDLQGVVMRDRVRIQLLVLVSVLVVLVLLIRQIGVSVYLLLSVVFSYFTTLGVAFLTFWLLAPQNFTGIDWKVVIFLFTILVAVGEDYNIFLMARVTEEQRRYGPVRGIMEAMARTGPIISSCGIIMAGTFASLLASSLSEMRQLGFALAFGILLDTFVVRPILVPAFLVLIRDGRLWPSEPATQIREGRSLDTADRS